MYPTRAQTKTVSGKHHISHNKRTVIYSGGYILLCQHYQYNRGTIEWITVSGTSNQSPTLYYLQVDSTQHLAYTNLAAAYLLQGKYQAAEKLYRQYKNEFKEGLLTDLDELAKAGVIPAERKADVEKIKKMLNE